jgi:hypothetical protein
MIHISDSYMCFPPLSQQTSNVLYSLEQTGPSEYTPCTYEYSDKKVGLVGGCTERMSSMSLQMSKVSSGPPFTSSCKLCIVLEADQKGIMKLLATPQNTANWLQALKLIAQCFIYSIASFGGTGSEKHYIATVSLAMFLSYLSGCKT